MNWIINKRPNRNSTIRSEQKLQKKIKEKKLCLKINADFDQIVVFLLPSICSIDMIKICLKKLGRKNSYRKKDGQKKLSTQIFVMCQQKHISAPNDDKFPAGSLVLFVQSSDTLTMTSLLFTAFNDGKNQILVEYFYSRQFYSPFPSAYYFSYSSACLVSAQAKIIKINRQKYEIYLFLTFEKYYTIDTRCTNKK